MGFVKTWQQLTVTRVFLGAFEVSAQVEHTESIHPITTQACYFPGMVLLISTWQVSRTLRFE